MTMKKKLHLVAKTLPGLEEILAEEIAGSGGDHIQLLNRAVSFKGDIACMYRVNYTARSALRVLQVIETFEVRNEHELYHRVQQVNWQEFMNDEQTLAVDAFVANSKITNSHFAAQKVKDSVVDQFRRKGGVRPSVDIENPDLRINLHLAGEECTLSLDSSGDSLHKRGYRTQQGEAPINEVLAAGMIMRAGWDGNQPFLDPMCGSGTLLIEAGMIARNIPAGFFRKDFGFMHWDDFDAALWKTIKSAADRKIKASSVMIHGCDVNQQMLAVATVNINNAGMQDSITLKQVAFEDSRPPVDGGGVIVTNPPYGERIQKTDLNAFYKTIGDVLKQQYTGWQAWLITSDHDALKSVGLRTSRKIKLYNGPLECRFVKYEMFSGSRKKGAE